MGSYELDNLFGFDKEESTLKGEYDGLKDGKKFREDFVIRILDPGKI
jgi:hypothetical protein